MRSFVRATPAGRAAVIAPPIAHMISVRDGRTSSAAAATINVNASSSVPESGPAAAARTLRRAERSWLPALAGLPLLFLRETTHPEQASPRI